MMLNRLLPLPLAFALLVLGFGAGLPSAPARAAGGCILPAELEAMRISLLDGINAERRARGLVALTMDDSLEQAAQGHACDNAKHKSVSHVSSNGSQLQHRLRRAGYRYSMAAENTGRGFGTTKRAVEWWMNSPHHKDNILLARTRDVGIGIALSEAPESRLHWVVNFGKSK